MNIVLIGMKHCGKSTQGKLLAEKLNWRFIDSDAAVEEAYFRIHGGNATCRAIYQQKGEEYFRRQEADAVSGFICSANSVWNTVFAFGGGTVGNKFLPSNWKELGLVVYLKAGELVLYSRIEAKGLPPFLADAEDPFAKFKELYAEREKEFTAQSDLIFELDMQASSRENGEKFYAFLRSEME